MSVKSANTTTATATAELDSECGFEKMDMAAEYARGKRALNMMFTQGLISQEELDSSMKRLADLAGIEAAND